MNIAMLSGMGKPGALKIHVRGALTNGATTGEIQEIFLQTCIYAGVSSAGEANAEGHDWTEGDVGRSGPAL